MTIVCPVCKGSGSQCAYLGAFTRDEMDEMGDEFLDDYRAGKFDRACETCGGLRVVRNETCEDCGGANLAHMETGDITSEDCSCYAADRAERRYFAMFDR